MFNNNRKGLYAFFFIVEGCIISFKVMAMLNFVREFIEFDLVIGDNIR